MPFLRVDDDTFRSVVSFEDAIGVLDETFRSPTLPESPQRTVLGRGDGQLLLMPSWGQQGAGVKLVTVNEANPRQGRPLIHGVYILFSDETLEPLAVFDAASLTAIRTASVSAVATAHLAAPDAARLVMFGSGVQAEAHAHALAVVRALDDIAIVARSPGRGEDLAGRLRDQGLPARAGAVSDVEHADVVCTCTTSSEPLFDGSKLRSGALVCAVGSHTPGAREVDSTTVQRAFVVVETRSAALAEAGDLLLPLQEGAADPSRVPGAELAEVVRDLAGPGGGDITLFKSVGVGFEDLALARFAYDRIRTSEAQNE